MLMIICQHIFAGTEMNIETAIKQAGGASEVARRLTISRQAVFGWLSREQVGAAHAWQLAQLIGIDPALLRPDVFLPAKKNAPV